MCKKIKFYRVLVPIILLLCICGGISVIHSKGKNEQTKVVITLFAAKSLNRSLDEVIALYEQNNPGIEIQTNYDSSGTLMTQIVEGAAACDVFFSAAEKQMDTLQEKQLIVEGTRKDLLKNQLCVVTYPGSGTKTTGLSDLEKATSLAIAGQSVPIGSYTREALIKIGKLNQQNQISSKDLSEALGGITINECANVGAVVTAIAEQANEVGTVYYSDLFGYEDRLQILEMVSNEVTGDIVYPVAQVINSEASTKEKAEAGRFLEFLQSAEAKAVFEKYHFAVNFY